MGGASSDEADKRGDVALDALLLGGEAGGPFHLVADRRAPGRRGGR